MLDNEVSTVSQAALDISLESVRKESESAAQRILAAHNKDLEEE